MSKRFEVHSHTHYSNIRLLDCINRPKDLINKAIELGLSGIAITDHEALGSHPEIDSYRQELLKENPNFKIALGNEIYLTDTREKNQKYYHFILIAKDEIGHKTLRELSSIAWINSYFDRGLLRVPTLKSELKETIEKYGKGHLIATTACLGGQFLTSLKDNIKEEEIIDFLFFCKELFPNDFYLEVAPNKKGDQFEVNKKVPYYANLLNLKIVIGTDAHYLSKEDREIHTAFLTSKEGERETAQFYEAAYLQSEEEIIENLEDTSLNYQELVKNSEEIYNKISNYTLHRKQHIVEAKVKNYPKKQVNSQYSTLNYLYQSNNIQERYWVNFCIDKLKELNLFNDVYLSRLEEEADIQKTIGEKLDTCIFAYPIFLQDIIDLIWESGSTVGAGRGSSCSGLNHYLLGVTQLDPIKWDLPYFRFLNKERIELPDIDLDISPSKREQIFAKIREVRGELGCVQVCTYGTETTRSAIKTACRGYRSEEYPDGIDVDTALYMTSLIPQERGFLWPVHDVVYGNPEKDRRPVRSFLDTVEQFPGLLDIIENIEGLISSLGIHASGVNFYDNNNPYETACFMKAKNGATITQYSLHWSEFCGDTKVDLLVTEVQDVIIQCLEMLQENGKIEKNFTLRQLYNKYLHPDKLPVKDNELWNIMSTRQIQKFFQFDTTVGGNTIKKLKPHNPLEMALCNGIMRLMASEKGGEMPTDRYYRMKNNPEQWIQEMDMFGLTEEEQSLIRKYVTNGVLVDQESLMLILMDKEICNFSLRDSNAARKIVGKKQMDKVEGLHQQVLSSASSNSLGKYVWFLLQPSMGYSFSRIHGLAYSFIGIQTVYLATYFPEVYWNTACLRVDSGLDEEDASNYGKIAKAVGDMTNKGIKIKPIDINKSLYKFIPDEEHNQIIYGLKALTNCGGEVIQEVIDHRPYTSLLDFLEKCHPKKQTALSLIKGGAFDELEPNRKFALALYLWHTCDKKKRITLQNLNGLDARNILPKDNEYKTPYNVYRFNKYLKSYCKTTGGFNLDNSAIDFLSFLEKEDKIDFTNNVPFIKENDWKKIYDSYMDTYRNWINNDKENILKQLNEAIFLEEWNKYAEGNLSHWEMESLCYYYHDHELKNLNTFRYGVIDFNSLPEQPIPIKSFKKGDHIIDMYNLVKIAGTCIVKNKDKATVTLLTTTGVVNVKMRKEQFAFYDKQISQINEKGEKKIIEKSWFTRGNMIIVQGIRRDNQFFAKKYASTPGHTIYKISKVNEETGTVELQYERAQSDD